MSFTDSVLKFWLVQTDFEFVSNILLAPLPKGSCEEHTPPPQRSWKKIDCATSYLEQKESASIRTERQNWTQSFHGIYQKAYQSPNVALIQSPVCFNVWELELSSVAPKLSYDKGLKFLVLQTTDSCVNSWLHSLNVCSLALMNSSILSATVVGLHWN